MLTQRHGYFTRNLDNNLQISATDSVSMSDRTKYL